jgi:hypothetical protein
LIAMNLQRERRRIHPVLVAGAAALLTAGVAGAAQKPPAKQAEPLPPEEARRMVRMMDDIYRSAVLTTQRMYVHDPGTAAAVTWAKQVMRDLHGKGWPEARIFASTDRPLNPDNKIADDFEREALLAFKQGKSAFEKTEGGVFRYASELRVTDKSCLMCHVRNKEGDLLGGVSYRALVLSPKGR